MATAPVGPSVRHSELIQDTELPNATETPAALLDGRRLVVVSNRQPYRYSYGEDGLVVDRPAGRLTAGLGPAVQRGGGTWIAWSAGEADDEATDEDPFRMLARMEDGLGIRVGEGSGTAAERRVAGPEEVEGLLGWGGWGGGVGVSGDS